MSNNKNLEQERIPDLNLDQKATRRQALKVGAAIIGGLVLPPFFSTPSTADASLARPPSIEPRSKSVELIETGDKFIDSSIPAALNVLRQNYNGQFFTAGPGHPSPWLRDNLDFGLVPSLGEDVLKAYIKSIDYWVRLQESGQPVIRTSSLMGDDKRYDTLEPGQICTNVASGYYDESLIFIPAVLEAYQISGDKKLLDYVKNCREAWFFGLRSIPKGEYLIYANPPIASDWADQINRRGYAINIEALWYQATKSLAQLEELSGSPEKAKFYKDFSDKIKQEINQKLFKKSIPNQRNAPHKISQPFGHYIGWKTKEGEADYFELDGNLRCILFGIADQNKTASIMEFINTEPNFAYLMGSKNTLPPAAKVVYGDYDPKDYAALQGQSGDGKYHNQYWVNVGAIAAEVYAKLGDTDRARYVLRNMATAFNSNIGVSEWYHNDGKADGSQWYQWPARAYLVSLFRGWAGISNSGTDLLVNPLVGNIKAKVTHMGKDLEIEVHDTKQKVKVPTRTVVDGIQLSNRIPDNYLKNGSKVDVYI